MKHVSRGLNKTIRNKKGELEMSETAKELKVKINTHGNKLPEVHGEWIDLYTAEDAELKQFEFKIISLGVSMKMPEGYYAHIVPRSSAFKNFGVLMTNSMGVIENDYSGPDDIWGFPALAMRETVIPKGTRLCQFRLFKSAEPVEFVQVEKMEGPNRGGFGSSGVK